MTAGSPACAAASPAPPAWTAWVWRLLFALLLLCGGAGLVLYLLLWIFVPTE